MVEVQRGDTVRYRRRVADPTLERGDRGRYVRGDEVRETTVLAVVGDGRYLVEPPSGLGGTVGALWRGRVKDAAVAAGLTPGTPMVLMFEAEIEV